MEVPENSRFATITHCGKINSNYAYNGTFAYIFSFGAISIYVYYNSRKKNHYQIYSRSWRSKRCDVLDVNYDKGFLLYETSSYIQAIYHYNEFVFECLRDNFDEFDKCDDLKLLDNETSNYLFKNLI